MSQENIEAELQTALLNKIPRYFRASGGSAHGKTGVQDTEKFAELLMVLQECALLVGERLEMNAVSYAYMYDGDETSGFRFDQSSDPANPQVVGAIQNRRVSMREFTVGLNEYMEGVKG
ncbi:MAG: hypothetical protein P1V20_06315 [Verrucomicrobiales bacterium]|nr:hypothetical protein [Verrucomicrobiales bacterium]